MVDTLKKVKSGDALVIPAATFNTFIDAARDFRARQQERAQTAQQGFRSSGIVLVKNTSGYDQDRFAILGIDSPIITPTNNEDEFKNKIAFSGVTPAEAEHVGRFVILAEPLADGEIGRAFAASCPVMGRPCVPPASATPQPPEHTNENITPTLTKVGT